MKRFHTDCECACVHTHSLSLLVCDTVGDTCTVKTGINTENKEMISKDVEFQF